MFSFITGLIGGFRTSMTILSVNLIFDLRDELSLKIKSLIGVFYKLRFEFDWTCHFLLTMFSNVRVRFFFWTSNWSNRSVGSNFLLNNNDILNWNFIENFINFRLFISLHK